MLIAAYSSWRASTHLTATSLPLITKKPTSATRFYNTNCPKFISLLWVQGALPARSAVLFYSEFLTDCAAMDFTMLLELFGLGWYSPLSAVVLRVWVWLPNLLLHWSVSPPAGPDSGAFSATGPGIFSPRRTFAQLPAARPHRRFALLENQVLKNLSYYYPFGIKSCYSLSSAQSKTVNYLYNTNKPTTP